VYRQRTKKKKGRPVYRPPIKSRRGWRDILTKTERKIEGKKLRKTTGERRKEGLTPDEHCLEEGDTGDEGCRKIGGKVESEVALKTKKTDGKDISLSGVRRLVSQATWD